MRRLVLVAALVAVSAGMAGAAKYTYVDLVRKLTDLEGLAALPPPGEKCQQWSSYDRASRYDEKTGKYVAWDANGDGGGFIRTEGDQFVFAEMEGPGVIWRIWSAAPGNGHVKIYLDGASEPTVDLPFIGYFDHKNPPFIYPSLVHNAASGQNCYVPIPFQKSCKIVADKDWGAYYHFTYTTYPKDTVVPTFRRELAPEELAALAAADKFLTEKLGTDPAGKRKGEATATKKLTVPAGGKVTAAALKGRRAITAIRVTLDPKAMVDPSRSLREVVLQISWDGEKEPSVWVPLGDFFGTAPGINAYKSLPLGMSKDGECYSFWYMPFWKKAVVELVNDGKQPMPLEFTITHAPIRQPNGSLGRFHAKWHRDAFLPTEPERWVDWPMLKTEGRGRFCGVMLHVWNPKGGWWGEGDEKFFVDGEKFPSTFGTGSEDYFGYAWCNPGLFQNCYHDQTISENNAGNASVNRWHITDNVPFQKSFEADIEKYCANERPTQYACVAYWYLAPGGSDRYEPVTPVGERTDYRLAPRVHKVPGAIEGEEMKVLEVTGGGTQKQGTGEDWSGEAHGWWTGAKPGDKLTLAVPVKDAGKYDVIMRLTEAVDYGIVQVSFDGQKIGQPIDLYSPNVLGMAETSLGIHDLTAGEHRLAFEIIGANEKAAKSYLMGLDYVKVVLAN